MSDVQSKVLYLGLDPERMSHPVVHCPVIEILPRSLPRLPWESFSHVIYTSRTTVKLLPRLEGKISLAVGRATAEALGGADLVAEDERGEGVIALLERLDLRDAHVFYPHSARARSVIRDYLRESGVRHTRCILYDTVTRKEAVLPDLESFEEIVFTSPSTVDAFVELYGSLPQKKLTAIGPVTEKHLEKFQTMTYGDRKTRSETL